MRCSVHGFLRPIRCCVPAVALLLVPLACDAPTPPEPGTVLQVAISIPSPTLRPGRSMLASAAALGVNGDVLNVPVLWTSLTPTLLAVGSNGELLGLRPGTAVLRATAGAVSSQVEIALVNPAAQIIELVTDTMRLSVPGGPTAVAARALDAGRGELVGALLSWSIEDTRIATVDTAGFVTPRAVGTATLVVSIDGISARRPIRVGATVTATSPHIDSISVATIVPGVPFTLFGQRFAATVSGNEVLVDGLAATVTAVVAGRVTAVLPSGAKVCLPTRQVQAQLRTTGGIGAAPVRLRIAPQRTLAVGEAALLTSADAGVAGVRKLKAMGAAAVKVWLLAPPDREWPEIRARFAAVAAESRVQGLPLIVHATSLREAHNAVREGAQMLVHSVQGEAVDSSFVADLVAARTVYVPTLVVSRNARAARIAGAAGQVPEISDPLGCVDAKTRALIADAGNLQDMYPDPVAVLTSRSRIEELNARQDSIMALNLRRLHAAGATIAVGTDAGNPLTLHGASMHDELSAMERAGIVPESLLVMATRNGAAAMRRTDFGTLAAGKRADLLVLGADPATGIAAFRTLRGVMLNGHWLNGGPQ